MSGCVCGMDGSLSGDIEDGEEENEDGKENDK